MVMNNQNPLQGVLSTLCAPPRVDGRGPVIAVTAAYDGVGSSYVARNLAILAAQHYGPFGQRVALVDLDLTQQTQSAFFSDPMQQASYGPMQGPYDATCGQTPFWQVSPDGVDDDGNRKSAARYGALYLIGDTGLTVTKFNWDEIKDGQNVHLVASRDYWHAMRDQFAVIIVDTPSFQRADTALTVIPEADKTVIVCDGARASDPAQKALSERITENEGRCAGLVINEGAVSSFGDGRLA